MGVFFEGRGGVGPFMFSFHVWGELFELAKLYGWTPRGTILDDSTWDGGYFSNDGQLVTPADAADLADALDKVFDSLPDPHASVVGEHVCADAVVQAVMGDLSPELKGLTYRHTRDVSPVAFWSEPEPKTALRDFIVYCRSGSFRIW